MIGLVAVTAAGRRSADDLAQAWPGETRRFTTAELPAAWSTCDALVCFLATGATVRLVASLLADKRTDPAVVCVDEGRRFAVALTGGHAGGNDLAERVADVLGAAPVVTTATDATGLPGIDQLGWPVEGDVAAVARAMLDGERVALRCDETWPLPALPTNVVAGATAGATASADSAAGALLRVTDRVVEMRRGVAVLRPPSLVVGVGASRGVSADEVSELVDQALADAQLSPLSVAHVATIDVKADEVGLLSAAEQHGWSVRTYPADALAGIDVPNPSEVVRAEVGTASVAEAAAPAGGGTLVVPKRKSAMATVAVARRPPRGRLAVVGLGPGARDLLTPRAVTELRRASVVVGLDQYVDQVRDLLRPGTRVLESGLGAEEERARSAVTQARAGHAVALIGSGDAGVYAMASPALEEAGADIDVVGVPGVTAALAAAAALGAPLGHDHAYISLSDLHTSWEAIERRVRAAADADLVVAFYNPRSRGRDWQLPKALGILGAARPASTPVGLVRDASRPGERVVLTTLAELDPDLVDMLTVVLVGSSTTTVVGGRMVTPRGYRWREGASP